MNILSLEEQMKLVKEDWTNIRNIKNPYEEVCIAAIKSTGRALQFITKENQTERICLEAVKKYGLSIQYVDESNITEELCLKAVKENGYAIFNIKNKTPEICFYAVLNKFNLLDDEDTKNKITYFLKNNFISNKIFYINISKKQINHYIKPIFNEECYDFIDLDYQSFVYLKDFLLGQNNNHFIVNDKESLDILREIAVSNNELIVLDYGDLNSIHKKMANRTIKI